MPFSAYLDTRRENCRALVNELAKTFSYVSILGTDVRSSIVNADKNTSLIREGSGECGFVVKMNNGRSFFEYSLSDISGDAKALAQKIVNAVAVSRENRKILPARV